MRYRVKEIFGPTLQGEGSMAGTPCHFVRLAGCNRWSGRAEDKPASVCAFCDTDFYGGTRMEAEDILTALRSLGKVGWVVLTGGEPTIQLDLHLVEVLKRDYQLMLETNGSNSIEPGLRDLIDHITCSPKQSREQTNLEVCDDLKILYPYISPEITLEAFTSFDASTRFLQPVEPLHDKGVTHGQNIAATVAECYRTGARLSLQQHKILGVK